jgi:hypothetical protein
MAAVPIFFVEPLRKQVNQSYCPGKKDDGLMHPHERRPLRDQPTLKDTGSMRNKTYCEYYTCDSGKILCFENCIDEI